MIKRYRANNGNLYFIEDTVEPDPSWIEEQETEMFPDPNYKVPYYALRGQAYPYIGDQLGMLYDDIMLGKFGEEAKTSSWATMISKIKEDIPKD